MEKCYSNYFSKIKFRREPKRSRPHYNKKDFLRVGKNIYLRSGGVVPAPTSRIYNKNGLTWTGNVPVPTNSFVGGRFPKNQFPENGYDIWYTFILTLKSICRGG